ncbi:hypothetical protein G7046_g4398 [Stylonectria norvegica]|nr:hypothetical protein G7046_g4398 [Stylonectria norvegica]
MRSRSCGLAFALMLAALVTAGFFLRPFQIETGSELMPDEVKLPEVETKYITHLVLLNFRETLTTVEVLQATNAMMELKNRCIHPILEGPYIRSIHGGKNFSPFGLHSSTDGSQSGVTHAFVVEFEAVEHREYWLERDAAHLEFEKNVRPMLETAPLVVDFDGGMFT